jgi:hypothetical protein
MVVVKVGHLEEDIQSLLGVKALKETEREITRELIN